MSKPWTCPLCHRMMACRCHLENMQVKKLQEKVRLLRKALKAHFAVLDYDTVTLTGLGEWLARQRKVVRRALDVK